MNAVSIAPVQVQATPIVSIASIGQPQTQIITSSTPIAITATTSQGQQLALASTQQAGQILGTPQITLAAGKLRQYFFTFDKQKMNSNERIFLCSSVDGNHYEHITAAGNVGQCNAAHHLLSSDDT